MDAIARGFVPAGLCGRHRSVPQEWACPRLESQPCLIRHRSAAPAVEPDSWVPALRIRNRRRARSEEHTSELQSQFHIVCRLLLEKKKKKIIYISNTKKKKTKKHIKKQKTK